MSESNEAVVDRIRELVVHVRDVRGWTSRDDIRILISYLCEECGISRTVTRDALAKLWPEAAELVRVPS